MTSTDTLCILQSAALQEDRGRGRSAPTARFERLITKTSDMLHEQNDHVRMNSARAADFTAWTRMRSSRSRDSQDSCSKR